ncbi:rho-related GTP-binding protein RhoF-like isoform 3-T3 [Salvelinus alpinus]
MPQNVSGMSSGHTRRREELKVVIVGDGGCGKTSLLMVYTKKDFPEKYIPSVFEKCVAKVKYRGAEFRLNLYDTAGQEDYDRLRPLSYPNANLVLICYDWYPEVHHFCHGVPIILVGCKTDLRKDKVLARKLWSSGQNPITYIQGEETKRKIKAELYLECSAKYKENVEDIFREATKRVLAATRRMWRTYSERLPNEPLQQQGECGGHIQRGYQTSPCSNKENVEDIFREATKRALAATRRMWRTYSERLPNEPLQQQGECGGHIQRGYQTSPCSNKENVEDIFREATKRALAATRRMWRTYSERLPNEPLQQQGNPERQRGTDSVPFCDPRDNAIHHRELLIQTIL